MDGIDTIRAEAAPARERLRSWLHTSRVVLRNVMGRKLEPEIDFLPSFLRPGQNCLHIGASDGRHTVVMSRLVGDGQVHCFEPCEYTFEILNRIVRFHGLRNVTTHKMALGEGPGSMNLITPVKSNGHLGLSFAFISEKIPDRGRLRELRRFRDIRISPTRVDSVDRFCDRHGLDRVDFIRCDVEGAEVWVLAGAAGVLERDRPVLLLEVHPHSIRDQFGSSHQAVRDFLRSRDYRFFYVNGGALEETDAFIDEPWRDYFCLPGHFDAARLPLPAANGVIRQTRPSR